jgi:hypothetical protein
MRFRVTTRSAVLLLFTTLLVALAVPLVTVANLRPTILFAVLAYVGSAMVAVATSQPFADRHLTLVLSAAFALNLLAFLAPAGALWASTRAHPATRAALLSAWGLAYLVLLYFAYPVGPGA